MNTACGFANGTTSIPGHAFKTTTKNWIGRKKNICLRGHQVDTYSEDKMLQLLHEYAKLVEDQGEQIKRLMDLIQRWREFYEQATT